MFRRLPNSRSGLPKAKRRIDLSVNGYVRRWGNRGLGLMAIALQKDRRLRPMMLWQYSAYFLLTHSKPSFKTAVPFLPFALANLSAENASLNDCPTPIEKLIENFFS